MKYIILSLLILLLTGCNNIEKVNKQDYFAISNLDIQVYDEVYLNDLIKYNIVNDDFRITSENIRIDTNSLGKKNYEINYEVGKKKYIYEFTLNIIDTIPPLVFSGTNKTVKVGYDGDLCNLITYGDNYDGNINCIITGDYDLNIPGTYKLKYNLSDSSNNTKEVNVTLNVKEKNNDSGTNTPTESKKTLFSDVLKEYKTSNNEIGIDVSKWQGNVDYEKVKEAGATFVMMRMGVQTKAKGELELDKYFKDNIINAKKAGLKVGIYLYSIATSSKEAVEQANWVLTNLNKESLDLPIAFDWESWTKWNSFKISFHEINSIANNFMTTIKDNGYDAMLYGSKFYLETIWTNQMKFPIWLAHYTKNTNYGNSYQIWQLCNNGKIDGINGDVDIDILYH